MLDDGWTEFILEEFIQKGQWISVLSDVQIPDLKVSLGDLAIYYPWDERIR